MLRRMFVMVVMVGLLVGVTPTEALTYPQGEVVLYVHVREILSATALGGDLIDVTLYLPQVGGWLLAYGPTDRNGYVRLVGSVYPGDVVGVFLSRGGLGGRFYLKIPLRFCGFREIRQGQRYNLWVTVVQPNGFVTARWAVIPSLTVQESR